MILNISHTEQSGQQHHRTHLETWNHLYCDSEHSTYRTVWPATPQNTPRNLKSPLMWFWTYHIQNSLASNITEHIYKPEITFTVILNISHTEQSGQQHHRTHLQTWNHLYCDSEHITYRTVWPATPQNTSTNLKSPLLWFWTYHIQNSLASNTTEHIYKPEITFTVILNISHTEQSGQQHHRTHLETWNHLYCDSEHITYRTVWPATPQNTSRNLKSPLLWFWTYHIQNSLASNITEHI